MTIQASASPKFRFLRVNPFRGLLIDENTWADAHDYHRNQMRFHLLALHGVGIVQGLEVVANQPPDLNVVVRAGVAIDPEGRLLALSEQQTVPIPSVSGLTTIFVVLEYSEKEAQVQNVTEGGQPQVARILESCRVRASLEAVGSAVELARISYDPATRSIRNPANPRQPGTNELDGSGRLTTSDRAGSVSTNGKAARIALSMGILRYGPPTNTEWKRHSEGVRRLLRDTAANTNLDANLLDGVGIMDETVMRQCKMLYMTGRSAFRFTPEEEQATRRFLDRGGILWLDPCRNGLPSGTPDDFSRSCIELTQKLNRQPIQPRAGHPLFTSRYLFAAPPVALEPAGVVVEANRIIITTGDYGCLWEGRGQERADPPSREVLRAAHEFGANALFLAAGQN